jgi:hypothetical protein
VKIGKPEDAAYMKALVFGPPGAGKTYLLGGLAEDERTSPALILDFEGGALTLVGSDIDVAVIRDWADYGEAYSVLSDPNTKYKSVGVDSLSETQAGGLLALLANPNTKRADPDELSQADWGRVLVQMRRFVRHFRDLPMHVAMTALAGDDLDKQEGKVRVPLLQGSFSREAPGIFDTVAYLGTQETEEGEAERVLLLRNYPGFRVKTRAPKGVTPPDSIVEPTITKLLDALGFTKKKGH